MLKLTSHTSIIYITFSCQSCTVGSSGRYNDCWFCRLLIFSDTVFLISVSVKLLWLLAFDHLLQVVDIAIKLGQIYQGLTITFEDHHNHMITYFKIMLHKWQGRDILSWCQKCVWLKLVWAAVFKCLLRTVCMERSAQLHQKLLSKVLLNENNKNQNPPEGGVWKDWGLLR